MLTYGEGGFTMADVLEMTWDEISWHCKRYVKHWKDVDRVMKKGK